MFEFSWTKCKQLLKRGKSFGANFPGKKRRDLGKVFLVALGRDLGKRALTLLEKIP